MDLNALLDPFVHQLVQAAVTAIASAVVCLLFQLIRKMHLTLTKEQEQRLNTIAKEAALYAEERVEAMVKRGTVKAIDTANKKASEALEQFTARVPGMLPDQAHDLIQRQLPQLGLGAAAEKR